MFPARVEPERRFHKDPLEYRACDAFSQVLHLSKAKHNRRPKGRALFRRAGSHDGLVVCACKRVTSYVGVGREAMPCMELRKLGGLQAIRLRVVLFDGVAHPSGT